MTVSQNAQGLPDAHARAPAFKTAPRRSPIPSSDRVARLADLAIRIADRAQVRDLAAALIDHLDATEDTDADLCTEDLAALAATARDEQPGDPDDAEASDGEEGWTMPADGVAFRRVVRLRASSKRRAAV